MSTKLLDGLAAALGGYEKGVEQNRQQQRQIKLDEQNQQVFQEQQEERQRVKDERKALVNASKQGVLTKGTGGLLRPESMDNRDVGLPENKALPEQGLKQGGYGLNGQVFADKAVADKALADYNQPEAADTRTAQALRDQGRPDQAMQYEAAAAQRKTAKVQEARNAFNDIAMDEFRTMGVYKGFAAMMTRTNALGLKGATIDAATTADGKMVEFYQTGVDGKKTLMQTVPNTPEGQLGIVQSMLKVSPEKLLDWYQDNVKNGLASRTVAVAEQKADAIDRNLLFRERGGVGGGSGGGGGGRDAEAVPGSVFNPLAGLDTKKVQAVVLEQVSVKAKEREAAGKPPMTAKEQANEAQELYRAHEDAFARENTRRFTSSVVASELRRNQGSPTAYAATFSGALKAGMDAGTLAAMGFNPPPGQATNESPAEIRRLGRPASAPVNQLSPGGITPRNAPADLADRAKTAAVRADTVAAQGVAKVAAAEAAISSKKDAIAWLTPSLIKVMKPKEAEQYLRDYQSVLSPELNKALRRQL